MNTYILSISVVGAASLLMVAMPFISKATKISYSVFFFGIGVIIYALFPDHLPDPLPSGNETIILHLTELIVIISLMGAGLKIDTSFSFSKWKYPLRLISVGMVLFMAATAAFGFFIMDLSLASAILLGAVLAPTDPVLAADVQVGPPNRSNSTTKFTLTSEAGLNDGMAFPFTWLAITVAGLASGSEASIWYWFTFHFLFQIVGGTLLGIIFGKLTGFLVFDFSKKYKFIPKQEGFIALSITFMVYGITELLHCYGFIAVFICSITLRQYEKSHSYHKVMHSFTDQIEKFVVAILLIVLGGVFSMGIFQKITWEIAAFALVTLLIFRPVLSYLCLIGAAMHRKEKFAISFFGIRGLGSLFYLAFAFNEIAFDNEDDLWTAVIVTVALSILIHGLSAPSAIAYLKRKVDE